LRLHTYLVLSKFRASERQPIAPLQGKTDDQDIVIRRSARDERQDGRPPGKTEKI